MSARITFDGELKLLHLDLVKMASMIETAIDDSIKALTTTDKELAMKVVEKDREVDDIEKSIEARCLTLLMRQQPVAKDLRNISTALKMITDMERIGDQAADIAELSTRFEKINTMAVVKHLPQMAKITISMVHDSINAFIQGDLELAKKVIKTDDEVDSLFESVKIDIISILIDDKNMADDAIDTLMIAKYLERIGDHAVNICEWVEFYFTGEHKNQRIL